MITSLQNTNIKKLLQLEKASKRKQTNLFIVEGFREISLAVEADYCLEQLFFCKDFFNPEIESFVESLKIAGIDCVEVSSNVFSKIAYRETSDGIVATVQKKDLKIVDLNLPENALILVLEAIEKPGNIGAILRTADAANIDAVIIADIHTDIFNPNVVRSSIGTLFTNNIAIAHSQEIYKFLKSKNFKIYAAALSAEAFYHQVDYNKNCAIVMGTEAYGLSEFWLKNCTKQIKIPMRGKIDSLNVSVSTAVLTFEAVRQRRG